MPLGRLFFFCKKVKRTKINVLDDLQLVAFPQHFEPALGKEGGGGRPLVLTAGGKIEAAFVPECLFDGNAAIILRRGFFHIPRLAGRDGLVADAERAGVAGIQGQEDVLGLVDSDAPPEAGIVNPSISVGVAELSVGGNEEALVLWLIVVAVGGEKKRTWSLEPWYFLLMAAILSSISFLVGLPMSSTWKPKFWRSS